MARPVSGRTQVLEAEAADALVVDSRRESDYCYCAKSLDTNSAGAAIRIVVSGQISVHAKGFGFVEWIDDGRRKSAFVPPPALRAFLHLDRVRAEVEEDPKGYVVRSLALEQRDRTQLFGKVTKARGNKLALQPDPEVANSAWTVEGSDVPGLVEGMRVVAEIRGTCVVVRHVIEDDGEAELQAVRDRYLIRHPFTPEVLDAAQAALPRSGHRPTGWRDLRELVTVTIDDPSSRDLDDALSVTPAADDGGIRVFVHIADVDSAVHAGTLVDVEARLRGTSVYLAGEVTPMLPRTLSEDQLSLLPGQERAALSVELRIDVEGAVKSIDIYPSTIRSNRRLSYEEVDAFLANREPDLPEEILDALGWLRTVFGRLSAVRAARGGLTFDRRETHIELGDDFDIVRVEARQETPAHLLIERIMVAANEAVARWLHDRGLPGVFRVHPAPEGSRVDELEETLERMGYQPGLASPLSPRAMSALERQFDATGLQPVLQEILGQILEPARYTVHPGQHFGLGSELYLHFTSPIRRYADLAVHRIVKAYLRGERDMVSGDPELETLAVQLNDRALRASKAEATRRRVLTARWASQRKGEEFSGHVVAVKPFGFIVQLHGTGVTGAVPTESLGGAWKHEGHQLIGEHKTWAIGDELQVTIGEVDVVRGRIDLVPVEKVKRKRRRRKRGAS